MANKVKCVLKADDGTYWVAYHIQSKEGLKGNKIPCWGDLKYAIQNDMSPDKIEKPRYEDGKIGQWVPYTTELQTEIQNIPTFSLEEIELAQKMIAGE